MNFHLHTLLDMIERLLMASVILSLWSSGPLHSQDWDDHHWHITEIVWGVYMSPIIYGIQGDTLINNQVFARILQSNEQFWTPEGATYHSAIRKSGEEYWLVPAGQEQEYLLYDFGMGVGDTLTISGPWSYGTVEVVAKDSIEIGGTYRQRLWLDAYQNPGWAEQWIEGIGSSFGLFYPGNHIFDAAYLMVCFHESEVLLYMDSPVDDCWFNTIGVPEIDDNSQVVIFPCPMESESTITSSSHGIGERLLLRCFDISGRLVEEELGFHNGDIWHSDSLENGQYFLLLCDSRGSCESARIVKH